MDMYVEHAGDHVMAARIRDLCARRVEAGAERGNLLADNADVADEWPGWGDDVPVFDDAIELHMHLFMLDR
jgi:hypothetical protein